MYVCGAKRKRQNNTTKFLHMDPLSAFLFSLLCSAAYDSIKTSLKSKYPEHITDKISKAFDNALEKWTPNEELRESEKKTLAGKITLVKGLIDNRTNPQDIDEETKSLLDLFRVELMSNSSAYPFLEELHWDKNETDLARLNQTTQEILAYIRPQKAQFYVNFPFNHFITKITPNQYYIPRKIQNALENVEVTGNINLISLIEKNKKTNIVVLASAGMGKTKELKQTAITLAKQESKYPIFVSFLNFTADKDIEYYLPQEWINIPQEKLVLLFDGFDELIDDQIHIIQRKLILFIENHPKITIVVSCRTNFYHLAINGNSETLKGFTAYYLQALTYEDVVNYVSAHHGVNGNMFMNAVYHKQFDDLVYNPFFLQILIPDFKQNNAFTGNRIQLFQKFIKERLSWDKEHFATSYSLNDEEERALELLRKVSIAMEMLGSRNIDSKDLQTLISDKSDFELIKHCTVFNKEESFEQWKFEHNNFQEILSAEKLAELPFETVIDFISFKGYNKIQPSWTNTVSFLISLLDENDILFQPLVDWIIFNDPEILVKVEKERIPQQIRTEIFIRIFEYYKGLNIWINSNKFSHANLAYFGQSEDTIEFIVSEILDVMNPKRIRLNAIHIFEYFSISDSQTQNVIKQKLLSILKAEEFDTEFIHAIIIAIENLGCTNKDTIDELMSIYGKRNSRYIRAAMYSLINRSKLADYYIDYYIAGLDVYLGKYTILDDREITSLGDEDYGLFEGIFELKTFEALSKFIDYYLLNFSRIEGEFEIEEHSDRLIYNCIELYKTEKAIFDYMYKLLSSESYNSWTTNKELNTLLFFKETNTKKEAIIKILKLFSSDSENVYEHIKLLSKLIEEENIIDIIEAYSHQIINETDLVRICKYFHSISQPLSELLKNEIYKSTGTIVEFQIQPNLDEIRRIRAQRSFDLLFDIELFKDECLRVFEKNTELHVSNLSDFRINENWDSDTFSPASVLYKLRSFKDENGVVFKYKVLDWFDNSQLFSDYSIGRIYVDLFRDRGDLIIKATQKEFIKVWFDKMVITVDFKLAIKEVTKNSFTINEVASRCVFFMKKFDLDCSENILLDMLSFTLDQRHITKDYVLSRVDSTKAKKRIIKNIQDESLSSGIVFSNHAEYVFQNHIYEVYSDIFNFLCESHFDEHVLSTVLVLYFKYNLDISPLKLVFDRLNFGLKIEGLRYLVKNGDFRYAFEKLIELHDGILDEENEMLVNNLLISCRSIKGLEFSILWIKKHMQSPFSQHGQSLVCFDKLDSLPYFMELLELGYNKEIKIENELNGMLALVLDGIYNLAIQSELNFNEVCSNLTEFIKVNKGELEEVEFLNATIERIKEKFFQTHSIKYNIKQIRQRLNALAL